MMIFEKKTSFLIANTSIAVGSGKHQNTSLSTQASA